MRRAAPLALRIYLAGLVQIGAVVLGFLLLGRIRAAEDASAERAARAAVEAVVARLGDEAAVNAELDRVARDEGAMVTVHDERGVVLATNRREGDPLPRPPNHEHPREPLFGFGPPPFPGPPPGGPGGPGSPGPGGGPWGPGSPGPGGPGGPGGPHEPHGFPAFPGPSVPAYVMPVRLSDGRSGMAVFARRAPPASRHDGVWIVAIVLVAVGVVSLLTARSLARPLGRLSRAARAFGAGELTARAGLARGDEIGDVAAAFDEMAARVTTLLHAEKELLANVSHELRTPLSRIRVALEIAEEGDAETARQALGDIAQDLGELEGLISDVLTAARLDLGDGAVGGRIPLRRERVAVPELLARAEARFRASHPARLLVVTVAPELPAVDGDPVLLRRVVDNLLENAHKYSPRAETEVELRAEPDDGGVRIEVRDRGMGIAPGDLPHLFRPFFRAERSRARKTGGLGLGLSLAKRIVVAHGGTITVESEVGERTLVVVRLPAAA